MLSELERKITAVVGDTLNGRLHLTVLEAPAFVPELTRGNGSVRVAISELEPQPGFEVSKFAIEGNAGAQKSRRVLPVQFNVRVEFLLRPLNQTNGGLTDARKLLLEDVSLVGHALGTLGVQGGSAFRTAAADPGFEVMTFALVKGQLGATLVNELLTSELHYRGEAHIWPPGPGDDAGEIRTLDVTLAPLPLNIVVENPQVRVGGQSNIRISALRGSRLVDDVRVPLGFAVGVLSDLPAAQRGTITTGQASSTAGFRVVTAAGGEAVVVYNAPEGNIGSTRLEYIAVHLATPQQEVGVFLGSAAVRLAP